MRSLLKMLGDHADGFDADGAPASPAVLDALLTTIADAVYVVDHEGRVRFANPAALDVLGYPAEELLGAPSHATIHDRRPDGRPCPESECPLLLPRTTGETVRVEEDWFVRRDGTLLPVSYSSAPFPTSDGRGAVVIFRDETERREAELGRRRAAAERARTDALEASRARIVEAADNERRRLGRNLHDGAQQRLMNVALGIQHALTSLDDDPSEARGTLDGALVEARETLSDLRDLASGIHPAVLTNRGLAAALASLTARAPLLVVLQVPDGRWPTPAETTAYYVAAEALANVAKHAQAERVDIEVVEEDGQLRVVVRDDGRGGAALAEGRGLQGIADRVEAVGGVFSVHDREPHGTVIQADIPLREHHRDET